MNQQSHSQELLQAPDKTAEKAPSKPAKREVKLRTRVITGATFSISMAALVIVHTWTTVILCSVLAVFCAIEFYAMLRSDAKLPNELIGIITAGAYPVISPLIYLLINTAAPLYSYALSLL